MAGRDVEKAKLIRPLCVIGLGQRDRVASVAQIDKDHTFHGAAILDVQAGNDAGLEQTGSLRRRVRNWQGGSWLHMKPVQLTHMDWFDLNAAVPRVG